MQATEQEGKWLYHVLKKIDFFSECSLGEIEELINNLIKKSYNKGQTVFKQGDDADFLYILYQGQLAIWAKGPMGKKKVAAAQSGNFFGEISLVTSEKKTATAVAETPCDFFLLFKNDFNDFVFRNPKLKENINKVIEKRNAERKLELYTADDSGFFKKLLRAVGIVK